MSLTIPSHSESSLHIPPQASHLFESTLTVAIDVSGSTYNRVLSAETQLVQKIHANLSADSKKDMKILPWNDTSHGAYSPSRLSTLRSSGGTDPRVLLSSKSSLITLQRCSAWFLFTDGKIDQDIVRSFAHRLAFLGVHGTSCVAIIFGGAEEAPANCNITVAVSVFAVSPNCLFLYHDVNRGSIHLLQCKGTFSSLLSPGAEPPILRATTTWDDLPTISIEDLCRVSIPPPQKLDADQIALPSGQAISLSDLWNDKIPDQQIIENILDDDEDLKAITLTAATRKDVGQLQEWLQRQDVLCQDTINTKCPKLHREASALVQQLVTSIATSHNETDISDLQAHLRSMHLTNYRELLGQDSTQIEKAYRRRSSLGSARRLSIAEPSSGKCLNPLRKTSENSQSSTSRILYTPGFQRHANPSHNFRGQCMLCGAQSTILSLLFRSPPSSQRTEGFPAVKSQSKLVFPLAMGNFPETDIVSCFICCESCGYFVSDHGRSPNGEEITTALPLVPFSINRSSWLDKLDNAVEHRFDMSDLPAVFLAILCTKIKRCNSTIRSAPSNELLQGALRWACIQLFQQTLAPAVLSTSFAKSNTELELQPLASVLTEQFTSVCEARKGTWLFQYPIEGFIVMTAAREITMNDSKVVPRSRDAAVTFQRFLFHLIEQYHIYKSSNGPMVTQLAMAQTVVELHSEQDEETQNSEQTQRRNSASMSILRSLFRSNSGVWSHSTPKISISIRALLDGPLLSEDSIKAFRRSGKTFEWVEAHAHYAIAVFLHYMIRMETTENSPDGHFEQIRTLPSLRPVFCDPAAVDSTAAENLIKQLD